MKYRKKPVVIEAFQLTFENQQVVKDWCGGKTWSKPPMRAITGITLGVNFNVHFGDYIFKDEDGTFHYCSPDIFEKTYSAVDESPSESDAVEQEEMLYNLFNDMGYDMDEMPAMRDKIKSKYTITKKQ